jgi:hypothetical protein
MYVIKWAELENQFSPVSLYATVHYTRSSACRADNDVARPPMVLLQLLNEHTALYRSNKPFFSVVTAIRLH